MRTRLIVLAGGLLVMLLGVTFVASSAARGKESATTTGRVSSLVTMADDAGSESCGAIARFAYQGQSFTTGRPDAFFDPCPYSVGQTVPVRFDPADPFDAAVPGGSGGMILGIVALMAGMGISIGALALRRGRIAAP